MMQTENGNTGGRSDEFLLKCIKRLSGYGSLKSMINDILKTVNEYYDADQSFIYELNDDKHGCANTYEYHNERCDVLRVNGQALPENKIKFWRDVFDCRSYICFDSDTADAEQIEMFKLAYGDAIGTSLKREIAVSLNIGGARYGSMAIANPNKNFDDVDFAVQTAYLIANEMQRSRALEKLEYMRYYDSRTGIKNRNGYEMYKKGFDANSVKSAGTVFFDINGLKGINEEKGSSFGDYIIESIAKVLSDFKKKKNSDESAVNVFRVSGDEFLLIWENCDKADFKNSLSIIKGEISQIGSDLVTTGKLWSDDVSDISQMADKAEQLMYIEKNVFYKKGTGSHSHANVMLNSVLQSIDRGDFVVYLQPKNSIKNNGEVYGAEALIRYVDSEKGIISPYKFIKEFEKEKIISVIDFFVFEEVCKTLFAWRLMNKKKIVVSVNFSRISLMSDNFVEKIEEICKKYDVDKNLIELEVTETTETLDRLKMIEVINQLKQRGFRISLDDFGCEYSSMDMLLAFDVDVLKIDKSLIDEITNSNKNRIVVRCICDMSNDMGVETIAEGVETEEQYNLLKYIGCACVQGYYFGKPMPVSDFEEKFLRDDA